MTAWRRDAAGLALLLLLAGCGGTPQRSTRMQSDDARLAEIKTNLGVEYLREGREDIALARLQEAAELAPNYAPVHTALGMLYAQVREFDDAERHYRRSLQLAPNDSATLNNFGLFLCQRTRVDEALVLFDRAAANPVYQTPEIAHSNAGTCLLQSGDRTKAEARFRQALQIDATLPPALLQMARLSFELDRPLPARGYLQRFEAEAAHTPASLWLGIRIERALGDRDALGRYEQRLQRDFPDSQETRLLLESRTEAR
ncbi:MAG: type IV pilus biogenesis/stability protein PilW [Gammaproteobacteria bacterium]|nr:type IV pilus biogenesis/stability protein PilW [Gammaproteobacteria bacterium]